ncbi:ABC transporter substrate-binding protein [Nonomuraea typhae]|uniref:ABC transporter substrate-binding protein n=1 Tax=Nonomuraea typhae TaxID=2603600 RepID=UPI0012FBFE30|nr:ABC transporter substrate-binding protein [Nonomuraea typhae]
MKTCAATMALLLGLTACGGRGPAEQSADTANASGTKVEAVVRQESCQDYEASPGVTKTTIKLGSSYPNSGPLASIGETNVGMNAYFAHLNDKGGINGRTIELIGKDDQYDPTKAAANITELLQRDRVFAIVGVQSTTGAMSVWDSLARQCVPILESTISSASPQARAAHLNAIDGLVPYALEGYALGTYVAKNLARKKVALIAQDGSFGKSARSGIEKSLKEYGAALVATQTFQVTDPAVRSQVTTLKASGADALIVVAAGTKCPQIFDTVAGSGWKPAIATTFTCSNTTLMNLAKPGSVDGVVSDAWVRQRVPGDAESDTYFAALKKHAPQVNAGSENVAIGWAQGQVIAEILARSASLTRLDVINTALALKDVKVPMAADGLLLNTSATDTAPVESVRITVYDSAAGRWRPAGKDDLIDMSGKLAELS